MSVTHNYLALNWEKVPYVNEQGSFDFLWDLEDEVDGLPDWILPVDSVMKSMIIDFQVGMDSCHLRIGFRMQKV